MKVNLGKMTSQRGATLLVGLIMLLLMTVIGLAAMRGSGMQELMAGNMRDRNQAFQAAEAGLRAGEEELNKATLPAFSNGSTTTGYVRNLAGSRTSGFWDTYGWPSGSVETDMELGNLAASPRYVIEEVTSIAANEGSEGGAVDFDATLDAEDLVFYRVTSRGVGGTNNAVAILQSTFKRQ